MASNVKIDSSGEYASIQADLGYGSHDKLEPTYSKTGAFRLDLIKCGLPDAAADFDENCVLVGRFMLGEHQVEGMTAAARAWIEACKSAAFPFNLDGSLR